MTDLDKLIEAVEAGTFTQTDFSWGGWHPNVSYDDARGAFTGSLDAAKRLHDALLPGEGWQVWELNTGEYGCNLLGRDSAYADTPARAWLLSILKALKDKGEA